MEDETKDNNKVDTVLHGVTFYSQNFQTKTRIPDVQLKQATLTGSFTSHVVFANRQVQKTVHESDTCVDGFKSKLLERRPKSVESARITGTNSRHRLIKKAKYSLLPYKRGQLKFCSTSLNEVVKSKMPVTLVAEKENKMYSEVPGGSAISEKFNVQGAAGKRFFKTSFGKRRQCTLSVHGSTANRMKLKPLKQRIKAVALRNNQLCLNKASDYFAPKNDIEGTAKPGENELSATNEVDKTSGNLCEDVLKNTEMAVEEAGKEIDSNVVEDDNHNVEVNDCNSSADLEQCSAGGIVTECPVMAALDSNSDVDSIIATPSQKRGILCYILYT